MRARFLHLRSKPRREFAGFTSLCSFVSFFQGYAGLIYVTPYLDDANVNRYDFLEASRISSFRLDLTYILALNEIY